MARNRLTVKYHRVIICRMTEITDAATADSRFVPIPPEPWGRRLSRVREDIAQLTLHQAAELANNFMITSYGSINRLERTTEAPTGRLRRQLAFVLCRAYRVDPAEFGLGEDDIPPGVAIPDRSAEVAVTSTKWDGAIESRRLRLAA